MASASLSPIHIYNRLKPSLFYARRLGLFENKEGTGFHYREFLPKVSAMKPEVNWFVTWQLFHVSSKPGLSNKRQSLKPDMLIPFVAVPFTEPLYGVSWVPKIEYYWYSLSVPGIS